jgi:hypothetical protein
MIFNTAQAKMEDRMKLNMLSRYLVIVCVLALAGCNKPAATSDNTTSSGSDATSSGGNSGPYSGGQNRSAAEQSPAPRPPVIIGAGTEITVTADQPVSSKTSNPGDHFEASLAAPVMVNGREVIPSGAKATGTVTEAKSAGKFKGNAELSVTLTSIIIRGQEHSVRTSSVTEAGKGRGKRTAIGAGGGAVVGGLIGAIAGGGKGAAIGAGAGAGAGTAGAAFTGERDITIPAETKLNFKLLEPLEIKRR